MHQALQLGVDRQLGQCGLPVVYLLVEAMQDGQFHAGIYCHIVLDSVEGSQHQVKDTYRVFQLVGQLLYYNGEAADTEEDQRNAIKRHITANTTRQHRSQILPATDAIEHIVAEGKVWFIRQPFGFVCGISHLHQGCQLLRLINDGAQDPHISQQLRKHTVAKWPELRESKPSLFHGLTLD